MLYHAYELGHAVMVPARQAADLQKCFFSSPHNPFSFTWASRSIVAACDVFESITRRYAKPQWRLDEVYIHEFAVRITPRVVWQKPFCKLIHFHRNRHDLSISRSGEKVDPRVLLVAPLSGHYATLLRQTVESFLPDHEVFVTDWVDAREVHLDQGHFDLNDYIDYIVEMLAVIGPGCHVVAICQPGPPVLAAIAVMSENDSPYLPSTMTYMGSPIDPRESPTIPNKLAIERSYSWFKDNVIYSVPWPNKGFSRRVYPGFLQLGGFISMNQQRHFLAHKEYFEYLVQGDCDSVHRHRDFYDEYLAVLDLTEEFYLQTIRDVFQEFKLPRGELFHQGNRVRPECIKRVALMTVEGEKDDISGIGQTQAAHKLCKSLADEMKVDYVQAGVGHYGVFSGSRFRSEIQPRIRHFMRSHYDGALEKRYQASVDGYSE